MPPDTVTCPYCNAFVPVPAGATPGRRVPCPRCGETFPLLAPGGGAPDPTDAPPPPAPVARPVAGNRRVAAGVVAVMVATAGAALAFALLTQKDRRAHDTAPPPDAARSEASDEATPGPEVVPLAPERYAALGYLPSRADVVLGVRVAELPSGPAGRELADAPVHVAGADLRLSGLAAAVGLRPGEVDHVALGLPAENPLDGVLVVRTRRPYDAAAVRAALKAKPLPGKGDGRTFYGFEVKGPLPLGPAVWFADDHTLVVAAAGALAGVPQPPAAGPENLPAAVRDVLRERVHEGGPVWLAGHLDNWGRTPLAGAAAGPGAGGVVRDVRTFAAWARPADGRWTVEAVARCADEAAAARLEAEVRDRPAGWQGTTVRDGAWVAAQRKTDPDSLRRLLRP